MAGGDTRDRGAPERWFLWKHLTSPSTETDLRDRHQSVSLNAASAVALERES